MAEKYKVIVNKLELELKKMRSEGRTRLPSEQDLCSEFSCSRQTIRAALDVLLQKGLIVKRRGAGSYIADDSFNNRTVFFMTEDCDRYQSPALISGLKEQLLNSKYELRSFSCGGSVSEESKILSRVINERPAALIIEPAKDLVPDPNLRLIEEIEDAGIPVIYLNSSLGKIHVVSDNYEGGRNLTKHILETGRKKTA
ncbi:MAG: GntR family transcriptional regulator, partial [Clostridiales bacterium]|nr:GntR family transcriptional regulator [Clostridiales bacterium]